MPNNATSPHKNFGFLTVSDAPDQGLIGGYLVLNPVGRPLEFHCTAPVRPNRAQEILYGPTLRPYLYGEQIGRALLERAGTPPALVFTDVEPALAVRDVVPVPVVFVIPDEQPSAESGRILRLDSAHAGPPQACWPRLHRFAVGSQQLGVPQIHREDEQVVFDLWQADAEAFDLAEPFGRIREAIEEARRTAR